ncbi:MAG: PilN domain-containing protein, partial [Dehalococcoidia bacterium]|nr:PilN domain-containing protein [Dehalococcoidia bacterium]
TAGLHALIDRQPVWEGVFRALSSLVPASIELDELTVGISEGGYRLEASGHSAGAGGASPEAEIATLIDALNDSVFFDDAGLITSEMHAGETGWTRFEIEAVAE